jgi:hypothetical protein
MYFFNYHPLKETLKNRELTDRQAMPYFIVFIGLTSFNTSVHLSGDMNGWDYLSGFIGAILSIAGVYYVYLQNGGSKGYDLIQKFIVLGWIVTVRIAMISIPLIILLFALGDFLGLVQDSSRAYDVLLLSALMIIFYQRIGRHIRDTNRPISEPLAPPDSRGSSAPAVR